jgi:hypothetical protein
MIPQTMTATDESPEAEVEPSAEDLEVEDVSNEEPAEVVGQ